MDVVIAYTSGSCYYLIAYMDQIALCSDESHHLVTKHTYLNSKSIRQSWYINVFCIVICKCFNMRDVLENMMGLWDYRILKLIGDGQV